jgi:hypothetical protein
MRTVWPSGIVVSDGPGGTCYRLPRPALSGGNALDLTALLGSGLMFIVVVLLYAHASTTVSYRFAVWYVLVANPLPWIAVALAVYAALRLTARDEIALGPDGLRAITRDGPFRSTHCRPLDQEQFLVISADPLRARAELWAGCAGPSPLRLTRSQPYVPLWPLARDLAERIQALGEARVAPQVLEEWLIPESQSPVRPVQSRVAVTEQGGETVFVLPPTGLRRGQVPRLVVGGAYLAGSAYYVLSTLLAWRVPGVTGPGRLSTAIILLVATTWLIGARHVFETISECSCRVVLTIHDGALGVESTTFFREQTRQWPRDGLRTITRQDLALRIEPRAGRAFLVRYSSALDRRSHRTECAWLAAALRHALRLDETGPVQERAGTKTARPTP